MTRILYYSIIMGIFAMLFGACQASQKIESVDSATFKERISVASEVQLLDVRTAEEFAEGHLESAINIDVHALDFTKRVSEN